MAIFLRVTKTTSPARSFKIENLNNWASTKVVPFDVFQFPEQAEENAEIISLAGAEKRYTVDCKLVAGTADLSEGTNPSTVDTVIKQHKYLNDDVFIQGLSESYKLEVVTSPSTVEITKNGKMNNLIIIWQGGQVHAVCKFDFIVGLVT